MSKITICRSFKNLRKHILDPTGNGAESVTTIETHMFALVNMCSFITCTTANIMYDPYLPLFINIHL